MEPAEKKKEKKGDILEKKLLEKKGFMLGSDVKEKMW